MTHPLITRLTEELGWPRFSDMAPLDEWLASDGVHVVFVPGTQRWNLEAPDVAVILPELRTAFQGQFDCAVIADEIEREVRERSEVFKTPCLIIYRDGSCLGGIPKVRDWDDYMARMSHFLATPAPAAAE